MKKVGKTLLLLGTILLTIIAVISIINQSRVGTGFVMIVIMTLVSTTMIYYLLEEKTSDFTNLLLGTAYSSLLIILFNNLTILGMDGTGLEKIPYSGSVFLGAIIPVVVAFGIATCIVLIWITMLAFKGVWHCLNAIIKWINN